MTPEAIVSAKAALALARSILRPDERAIIDALVDGASFEEVAAEMGCATETVRFKARYAAERIGRAEQNPREAEAMRADLRYLRRQSEVYVLRLAERVRGDVWRVKIGWTSDIVERWGQYRCNVPMDIEPLVRRPGNTADEQALLMHFRAHRWASDRKQREWFDMTDQVLEQLLSMPGWRRWDPEEARLERASARGSFRRAA